MGGPLRAAVDRAGGRPRCRAQNGRSGQWPIDPQERTPVTRKRTNFIRITRRFEASPERVFDAWIDPQTARKWLFTSPSSETNSTEMDARVGGTWKITDRRGGTDYTGVGEYVEIDRPHRL